MRGRMGRVGVCPDYVLGWAEPLGWGAKKSPEKSGDVGARRTRLRKCPDV